MSTFDGPAVRKLCTLLRISTHLLKDRPDEIYSVLEQALKDERPHVRVSALHCLKETGDARAIALLRRVLREDSHHWVRRDAAIVLAHLGALEARDEILAAFRRESSLKTKGALAEVLARWGDAEIVQELLKAARHTSSQRLRQQIVHALTLIAIKTDNDQLLLTAAAMNENVAYSTLARACFKNPALKEKLRLVAGQQEVEL